MGGVGPDCAPAGLAVYGLSDSARSGMALGSGNVGFHCGIYTRTGGIAARQWP